MATDGRRIVYNPAFVESVPPPILQTLLAHEVMHCALGHHCRRGTRDPKLWNKAADLAINPLLKRNGMELWEGALLDPQYDDLSAEEIYAQLNKSAHSEGASDQESNAETGTGSQPTQQGDGAASPSSSGQTEVGAGPTPNGDAEGESSPWEFGEVVDATDEEDRPASPAEQSLQQHEWSLATEQALNIAKACGHAPSNVDRPVRESRESKQDWRSVTRAFVAATTISDYRWTPPNRRHISSGLYLPSVERSGVGTMVIGVDTSGSVGKEELEQFAGEITAISDEVQPDRIYVVYCDAAVNSVQEFGPSEPISLEPKGGGGTDFRPVFDWVEENAINPACLIYLTDLCCESYPVAPDYPVLWATDSRRTAPFGEMVRLSVD
jgi:predicted metal-dependent peptidase